MAKHYNVTINYDDPYPKSHPVGRIKATSAGRAAYLAEKLWRKTRPRKHEPNRVHFLVTRP